MSTKKWDSIVPVGTRRSSPPGVRRFSVPGGYLYQVENYTESDDGETWTTWFSPVFVPFHGDGGEA